MKNDGEVSKGSVWQYVTGFVLSLALTLTAYQAVQHHINSGHLYPTDKAMIVILSVLAVAQLAAQLIFFLHLNRESKPRWNLTVAAFAAVVVFILVFGSLWIMHNLNYHPTDKQIYQYLNDQGDGI